MSSTFNQKIKAKVNIFLYFKLCFNLKWPLIYSGITTIVAAASQHVVVVECSDDRNLAVVDWGESGHWEWPGHCAELGGWRWSSEGRWPGRWGFDPVTWRRCTIALCWSWTVVAPLSKLITLHFPTNTGILWWKVSLVRRCFPIWVVANKTDRLSCTTPVFGF